MTGQTAGNGRKSPACIRVRSMQAVCQMLWCSVRAWVENVHVLWPSYEYHKKALHFFIESMGIRSYRAADLRHKCAIHLTRLERYEEAM